MTDQINNKNSTQKRTVFALATPANAGTVALVRVSGPLCESTASALGVLDWKRSATTSQIRLDVGKIPLILWAMPAPSTFTGQNTLEIFAPAHPEIVTAICDWLEAKGCQAAEAGEFTRLAVENGKLDLSRAEAVMALITAQDDAARRRALADLSGQSAAQLSELTEQLRQISARFEMLFDFSEEEHAEAEEQSLIEDLREFRQRMQSFSLNQVSQTNTTPTIALFGLPNAGKSSLFNALLNKPRSLVFELPGTTRDAVSDELQLGEVKTTLDDLSGVGGSDTDAGAFSDAAMARALEADTLLLLSEPDNPDGAAKLFNNLEAQNPSVRARTVWVNTKTDKQLPPTNPLGLEQVDTSAASGTGLDELKTILLQRVQESATGGAISLQRQRASEATRRLEALEGLAQLPAEAVASEVRRALRLLDEALLSSQPGDVLDLIFSRFCIGK